MRRATLFGAAVRGTDAGLRRAPRGATAAPTDDSSPEGSSTRLHPRIRKPWDIASITRTDVLMFERSQVEQFDAFTGEPVNFSGLGTPILSAAAVESRWSTTAAVPTQGNIYVLESSAVAWAVAEASAPRTRRQTDRRQRPSSLAKNSGEAIFTGRFEPGRKPLS